MIIATAVMCLSLNIYHEARGENIAGQYAVALVTMNRAGHDKNKVCKVVLKARQFSWTNDMVEDGKLLKSGIPKESRSWEVAQIIAKVILSKKRYDFTNGSMYYHTKNVDPVWNKSMVPTKIVGRHIFYKRA